MKKKLLGILLAGTMVFSMAACGSDNKGSDAANSDGTAVTDEGGEKAESNGKKIGVCMPTQSSERWINDGANMKKLLEAKGYEVDVQFAEDDTAQQVSQVENFVGQQVDCIVIASVDSKVLVKAEEQAKDAGIPVIAYDRLLMNTDAVSYYATFDNIGVGRVIGNYIKEHKDLDAAQAAGESYTIEFFMGSPDDNNALLLYDGVMEVLQPYLDSETLVCKSGRTSFDDTCILRWSSEQAQKNAEDILTGFYADEDLDIACTALDGFASGVKSALEGAGYTEENWPLITGQDADVLGVKNIINGSQTMTIYKDTRLLAEKCAGMIDAVLNGTKPEINETETYDNGVFVVPTYICEPVAVDKDNYKEVLIDSGYYTEEQLAQ